MNIENYHLKETIKLAQAMKDAGKLHDFEIREIGPYEYQIDLYYKPAKAIEFIQFDINIPK